MLQVVCGLTQARPHGGLVRPSNDTRCSKEITTGNFSTDEVFDEDEVCYRISTYDYQPLRLTDSGEVVVEGVYDKPGALFGKRLEYLQIPTF